MKKSYTRELKGKDWEACLDKSFKKNVKDAKIDGFRKGQAPKDIYIKKYGIESLYMDAVDEALPKIYDELMAESDVLVPACQPTVDIKAVDEKHIEVEFTLVSMPEVKLGKYKNIGIKRETIKVTKEEIDHEIEHLKEQFAELKTTEDKIKNGHIAVIDFKGFMNNKPFDGGKGDNYSLTIGSSSFIPGFEEGLIGLVAGDEKELNLKFPDTYHADDLKGKDVIFKVKINEVKERIIPKLNEDFFKDLGMEGIDTEEKLRKEIESNIKVQKERQSDEEYVIASLDATIKNAKFTIEDEIVFDECERIYKEFASRLSMQGMNIDDYLKITNSTKEDLMTQMKPEAEKRVSYRLVIDAVGKKEDIKFTSKEIDEEISKIAKKYNMSEEEVIKSMSGKEMIEYDMRMRKSLEIITGIKKED